MVREKIITMRLKVIVPTFLLILIYSCSLPDEDYINPEINGLWHLEKQFLNNVDLNISDCQKETIIEFADNNLLVLYEHSLVNGECLSETKGGYWTQEGEVLTIEWDVNNFITTHLIVELSGSTLILETEADQGLVRKIYN